MTLPQVLNYIQQFTSAEQIFLQGLADISYSQGDILYFNGSVLTRLAAGTSGNFLKTQGAGANPIWSAVSVTGTVTNVASADGSITVTNPTTTVDLAVVKSPKLTTARTIGGVSFDGTANITVATATGGFTVSGGDLAIGVNNLTITGSVGATGARVTKVWTADLEITNLPSVGGVALTTTIAKLNFLTSAAGTTGTASTNIVFSTSPTLTTPILGVASATSLATSAASPFLITNGQLLTVTVTSQTTGGATLTIPDFASVSDEFVFKTKSVTMSNKTFVAPVLGAATATSINGLIITSTAGTLTIANNASASLITSGNFALTLTATATTNATIPAGTVTLVDLASTQTLSAKFITPQLQSVTDAGGTFTPVSITNDMGVATALSQATTIAAPTGSPVQGERLIIRLKDNGTARALTWNAIYRASSDLALPTTTVLSKTVYCGFIYNSTDTKWDLIALLNNF